MSCSKFRFHWLLLGAWLTIWLAPISVALPCDDLLVKAAALDPRLPSIINQIKQINPAVVRGEVTPTWQDFDLVSKIATQVDEVMRSYKAKGKLKEVQKVLKELDQIAKIDPIFHQFVSPPPSAEAGKKYLPTEYELKRLYFEQLESVNRLLPKKARLRYPTLELDPRATELQTQGENVVASVRKKMNKLFKTTSGYTSKAAFISKVIEKDPLLKEITTALMTGKIEISMRRPKNGRWWVPKVGFQNQFVTGSSRGTLNGDRRNNCEASALGLAKDAYVAFDAELKPKYGSIRPAPDSGLMSLNTEDQYGEDIYILDDVKLADRITWSQVDSLRRYGKVSPGSGAEYTEPVAWDQVFIPWNDRELLAPYMVKDWSNKWVGSSNEALGLKTSFYSSDYIEIQVFGPVTLDHVKAFEFTKEPPTGELLQELQKRKIPIRDGRSWPPVAWEPPSPPSH